MIFNELVTEKTPPFTLSLSSLTLRCAARPQPGRFGFVFMCVLQAGLKEKILLITVCCNEVQHYINCCAVHTDHLVTFLTLNILLHLHVNNYLNYIYLSDCCVLVHKSCIIAYSLCAMWQPFTHIQQTQNHIDL